MSSIPKLPMRPHHQVQPREYGYQRRYKISFRVDAQCKARAEAFADERGVTLSELFREWVRNGCPTERSER